MLLKRYHLYEVSRREDERSRREESKADLVFVSRLISSFLLYSILGLSAVKLIGAIYFRLESALIH